MSKFVLKETKAGFSFNLLAGNGEVIATSEVYKAKKSALNGIRSVKVNSEKAAVEDQTATPVAKAKNPKFELYTDKAKKFRFRLKAANGEIIASSEAYEEKRSAVNGIKSVQKNAPKADIA